MDTRDTARPQTLETRRRPLALLAIGVIAALAGNACAKKVVQAAPAEVPGLVVPVIPPRVFAPLPEEPAEEAQPQEQAEPQPAPQRPARPRPRPERPADAKPEPARPEPTAATETPQPTPTPATPPLRPHVADDSESSRRIRATIQRATAELQKVNTVSMTSDARMQYETARRFVDQAEGALTARNYMFATYLADKAEALAKGLVGR